MLPGNARDRFVETCAEIAGDALRSIVYFTEDDFDQIFLRDYLSADADIQSFVENERGGFHRIPTQAGSELGRYEYTIQRFQGGYLVRVLSGEHGVFVTTNQMPIERYDRLATAIGQELEMLSG